VGDIDTALADAQALLRRACAHLQGDLDREQLELYDAALCRAELDSAQALRTFAAAGGTDRAFLLQLATSWATQVLSDVHHRLCDRAEDFGLDASDLKPFATGKALSAATLQEIGRGLLERRSSEPADGLDTEKRLMRESFEQFGREVVVPRSADIHRSDLIIPDSILDPLREMGCFGLSVPNRFGGLKPDDHEDSLGMVVVTQALSRASLGAAGSLITRPEIMARAILEGGTQEQQARWLPGLAAGDPLCAISVTEPDTGSDVAAVTLRADRVEGGWLLNGNKTWCTFAGKAGAILVLARTDAAARPLHKGLSLFVVEKPSSDGHAFRHEQPGGGTLTGRAIPTIGYRGMHSFEMRYDNWLVPAANLIGEKAGEGRGFYFTMRGFMGGRLQTAARACGIMQAAMDAAMQYAQARHVFGSPLASYPLTLAKIARMGMALAACQQFTYGVARLMDAGEGAMEASLVKLIACRCAEWVTREALQIHGGMGYAEETPVSRYFVDARVLSIFEGAEETLAIRVIGKDLVARARS
jgi:(2S)-methylsuccinyl-CoA dehydrogenase